MPKTPPPNRRGGSTRRSAPVKVAKPFPWGTVVGSAVIGLALIGLLVYAATNQGSGIENPDTSIDGVVVADADALTRGHVDGPVEYEQNPPNGGDHNGAPQTCAVYDEPIAPEHAVHSLEHGAVWVTYNDDASEDDVSALREEVEGDPYRLMSPNPEQDSPIVLTAWGRTLALDSADDGRVGEFLGAYTNGRQTPEKGAVCSGVTTTGPVQGAAPVPAPSGSAAPVPSPAAQ
jgi:hypothetical protein